MQKKPTIINSNPIPALVPRGIGHQFVCYADCCSGIPGTQHEANFAAVNTIVSRLSPQPEFICFPGDEVRGLTGDMDELREQWHHWLAHEMNWMDPQNTPIYHTTGNHTTYDTTSEAVFREMLPHLPKNGPPGQEGLSYFIQCGDLLMVFVNTTWSGLGGEGRVETDWLDSTLAQHGDTAHKLVFGHHPVYPVNGFSGPYQREIGPENGQEFWQVLVNRGVLAYICSHMLAFDVQVHEGVLQIMTAGAGTVPLMPADCEYHHFMQAALDSQGLRYQVFDTDGKIREWLSWPLELPHPDSWDTLSPLAPPGKVNADTRRDPIQEMLVVWRISGVSAPTRCGGAQALLSGWNTENDLAPLWAGLLGSEQLLGVLLRPAPGRSPHLWRGPLLPTDQPFSLQLAIHTGMRSGGLLWRWDASAPWSSLKAASPWGPERLAWPDRWSIGHGWRGPEDQPFLGTDLQIQQHTSILDQPSHDN